jgi:hypothetical protein
MTKEIVRELLNGEWVTAVRDAGSGGGSVSEITSTDMSVTITDPTGPTVDLSVSGGSQTVRVIRLPIAFDTPNLVLTSVPLFTPVVGDYIGNYSFVAVPVLTAWNGTTPVLHFGVSGALTALDSTMSPSAGAVDLTQAVTPIASAPAATVGGTGAGNNAPMIFTATTPVTVMVDDGAGGDPGSTQGAGEIIVLLLSP